MQNRSKIVGVIGGMGPEATVDFMSRVLRHTDANNDQQHVRLLVEQNPHIPSRQAAMRGEGEDPGSALAEMATRLQHAGAEFIVMPCNLAHAWQSHIVGAISIPFISIVDESINIALQQTDEATPIGLLTTPGCFAAGLYQEALLESGRPLITQTADELDQTMQWVNRIKSGDHSSQVQQGLLGLAQQLVNRGAGVIIAACTEFPILLDESMFDVAFVSSTDVLARRTIALARSTSAT